MLDGALNIKRGFKELIKDMATKMTNKSKPAPKANKNKGPNKEAAKATKPSAAVGGGVSVTVQETSKSVSAAISVSAVASVSSEVADVVLTDAEGRRYCRATDCDQIGLVDGYCRYHYLYFWKKIQNRKRILADGKLERYIEELTARYTDKFIELLRKDLRTEKDFLAAVQELELDDSSSASQQDEDEAKSYLEEISGVASESSSRDEEGY